MTQINGISIEKHVKFDLFLVWDKQGFETRVSR